jgi:hypothetical protein
MEVECSNENFEGNEEEIEDDYVTKECMKVKDQ